MRSPSIDIPRRLLLLACAGALATFAGCATAPPAPTAPARPSPAIHEPHVQPPAGPATALRIGVSAGAKFNQYALYLKRIVDAVQPEWTALVLATTPKPPAGTYVVVQFRIDAHGAITQVDTLDNHSSEVGQRLCLRALTGRAPFGEWTQDMKSALNPAGEDLKMTFWYR